MINLSLQCPPTVLVGLLCVRPGDACAVVYDTGSLLHECVTSWQTLGSHSRVLSYTTQSLNTRTHTQRARSPSHIQLNQAARRSGFPQSQGTHQRSEEQAQRSSRSMRSRPCMPRASAWQRLALRRPPRCPPQQKNRRRKIPPAQKKTSSRAHRARRPAGSLACRRRHLRTPDSALPSPSRRMAFTMSRLSAIAELTSACSLLLKGCST